MFERTPWVGFPKAKVSLKYFAHNRNRQERFYRKLVFAGTDARKLEKHLMVLRQMPQRPLPRKHVLVSGNASNHSAPITNSDQCSLLGIQSAYISPSCQKNANIPRCLTTFGASLGYITSMATNHQTYQILKSKKPWPECNASKLSDHTERNH